VRLEYLLSGADDRSSLFSGLKKPHSLFIFFLIKKHPKDKPIGGCNDNKVQDIKMAV
jgi:hypothetical protein